MTTLAIGGNPNCGKSALFNALTGIRQTTGNWPGVTVDRKEGLWRVDGRDIQVVDLPGIYSLDASSLDEEVTRDYLLSGEADLEINLLDAANLERNLYFTVQLREMGLPMVIVLNMMDVARKRGIHIDTQTLARELGCTVIPMVAVEGKGVRELADAIREEVDKTGDSPFQVVHDELIEQAISDLSGLFSPHQGQANIRWLALKLLEQDPHAIRLAQAQASGPGDERLREVLEQIEQRTGEEAEILIADARYSHAHALAQKAQSLPGQATRNLSDRIDQLVLNRFAGIPIFLAVMYLLFMFTINVGGAFIDFFDQAVGAITVDGLGHWLGQLGAPAWLVVLLANGIGGGIQVVSTFIPIVACLYLFLSALEDSGYMARAAFVMDRAMRAVGLPGKAFVPLIVGFGCNVPAVMATRTLENPRERKLTILMNPFMSCGARLPVYALFVTAFFPRNGQNLVFLLYLLGILAAVLTGLLMRRTLLGGESSGFIMELPPYHLPRPKGIALRTWDRVKVFARDAGKVILVMVFALNLLSTIDNQGNFGKADAEHSLLGEISRQLTPAFAPMGLSEENWPATVGILSGVLAKEVVVGTLDTLYGQIAGDSGSQETQFDLVQRLQAALATIPSNLSALAERLLDPLGMDVGDSSNLAAVASEQEVSEGIFGTMVSRFDGQAGAFAYLLFILLYSPCVATMGAIRRETSRAWTLFVIAWTTGIAYATATLYYQLATWSQHPQQSLAWSIGLALSLVLVFFTLRAWGQRGGSGEAEVSA